MPHEPPRPKTGTDAKNIEKKKAKTLKRLVSKPPGFLIGRGFSLQPNAFNQKFKKSAEIGRLSAFTPGLGPKAAKKARRSNPTLQRLAEEGLTSVRLTNAEKNALKKAGLKETRRRALLEASLGITPRGLQQRGLTLLSQALRLGA